MPFKLNVKIGINDPAIAEGIGNAFESNFGDRGSDEPLDHYVERKTEEWIVRLYANQKAHEASHAATRDTLDSIQSGATVKLRKDKPAEEEDDEQPRPNPKRRVR